MDFHDRLMSKIAEYKSRGRMSKDASVGDLTKAITYIVLGGAAAAGAGVGLTLEKGFEPTDIDIGNAQRAYAIANLKANIDSQRRKLLSERQKMDPLKKPMRMS